MWKLKIQNRKKSRVGEVAKSLRVVSPDLRKDETPDHTVDQKGTFNISLMLLVNLSSIINDFSSTHQHILSLFQRTLQCLFDQL